MPEEFNLPKIEEKILKFWEKNQIFEKSLAARKGKRKFIFYEGPPYANGKPGIHHVLARIYKDIILRYKTMRGYYVPRRAGWDTHGLPVEMATEKALGFKSKKDIEKYGVKLFNEKAKEQVWVYKDEWEEMTRRIGYWLDLKNAYVTYEPEYIETLWWAIAQIWKRKLLYKGKKVVPWCTRCGTALSSHELAQGYKETVDQSVYIKFKLKKWQKIAGISVEDNTYILSWTTTPWTLPGNVALAVGKNIDYAIIKKIVNGKIERWIVAKDLVEKVGLSSDVRDNIKGSDLLGISYEPLFKVRELSTPAAYKIYAADFVTTKDGTGVVHTAVMYGEDDYQLGTKVGLPQYHTVDEEGKFNKDVPGGLTGLYVKSKETEEKIFDYLKKCGNFLRIEKYTHEYPYCWRCDTPVIYYARISWFIAMSKLRAKLLVANKKINWIPKHLRDGRFGEWLREAKDWNLSRERYWGTPLPIWECLHAQAGKKCGHYEIIGGLEEFNEKSGGARNNYWIMRHGESQTQLLRTLDSGQKKYHLTTIGRDEVARSLEKLKKKLIETRKKIDMIFSSGITRTKESAEIAASQLGIKKIIFDKRLEEIHLGVLSGCHDSKYGKLFPTYESKFEQKPERGESLRDLRERLWNFLSEVERKHKGKNILIVSHEYPIWMLYMAALGWSEKRAIAEKINREPDFFNLAELGKLEYKILPRNDTGVVDLHKPFTDLVVFKCKNCGGKMARVREVADVWFDSGAMPFAQVHFPFGLGPQIDADSTQTDAEKSRRKSALAYPADYIAEGMDQTRGWFYLLLAVATALGQKAPYKNVISLGLVNDKFGQKMSKSKGNVVDPWPVINKYGADAVRWYFYAVNPPGETKNFDEAEILKTFRRMHLILWNSFVFYKIYASKPAASNQSSAASSHVLDRWISARLQDVVGGVTKNLDRYQIRESTLLIEEFVNDLSRWYIRRSRRRFSTAVKSYGGQARRDYYFASATLGFVLQEIVKLIAPFTPFFAEFLWENLGYKNSVHLHDWPETQKKLIDKKLIGVMFEVRRLASLGLAKRAEAGIKVRQPLATLKIKIKLERELAAVLADEVNVKKIIIDSKLKEDVWLDAAITPELREEGVLREVARMAQDLRQRAGLRPQDKITFMIMAPKEMENIISRKEKLLKAEIGAKDVRYNKSAKFDVEETTKIENQDIWIGIRKL